ncbi:MAG: S41 family peptidase, partial [Bacteroidota bacterium]
MKSSRVIESMLNAVGSVPDCTQCFPDFTTDQMVNINWGWMETNPYLSKIQSEELIRIRDHYQPIKNSYIQFICELKPNAHGLEFIMDDPYEDIQNFGYAERLMTLFTYWNIIEYYYPYKYLSNSDWDKTLEEAIPIFIAAESQHDFQLAMLWISRQINDSHAYGSSGYLRKNYFGQLRAPFGLKLVEDSIVSIAYILSDSLAAQADIRLGDQVIELNSRPIWDHIHEKSKYTAGANKATFYKNCLRLVLRDTLESMSLKIKRDGEILARTVDKCEQGQIKYPVPKAPLWGTIDEDKNIVFCKAFPLSGEEEARKFIDEAKEAEGIILDLRPFTGMKREVFNVLVKAFCPEGAIDSRVFQPNEQYPGITEFLGTQTVTSGRLHKTIREKPIAFIVGENAISLDEYRIMILQTNPTAYTIGSPTSGALADKGTINLPGGFTTYFTQKGMTYPDGTSKNRST